MAPAVSMVSPVAVLLGVASPWAAAGLKANAGVGDPEGWKDPDRCSCIPWNIVYRDRNITCGEGPEFFHLEKRGANYGIKVKDQKRAYDELCTNFFLKMKNNYCMNADFEGFPSEHALDVKETRSLLYQPAQWCYVDTNECRHSVDGMGTALHGDVAWKFCEPHAEEMTREKPLLEIQRLAEKEDVDIGLLLKMSFATHSWVSFEEALAFHHPSTNMTDFQESDPLGYGYLLRLLYHNERPVLFDRVGGNATDTPWHASYGVVQGHTVFEVQAKEGYPTPATITRNDGTIIHMHKQKRAHPNNWTSLECIYDCE